LAAERVVAGQRVQRPALGGLVLEARHFGLPGAGEGLAAGEEGAQQFDAQLVGAELVVGGLIDALVE